MGRLIDEDDVVKEIAISTYNLMDEEDNKQLIDDIRLFVPTAQPDQKWIPCGERLPEYGTAVLTCNDYGECDVNHIIDEDNGEWFWNDAVAWMPLPEPWRGEEDERE